MGFKVEKFCGCVELRVGCIVIGIVQVLLPIIALVLIPRIGRIDPFLTGEILYTLIGSVSLIFAAVNKTASMQTKTIAILIYIGTRFWCLVFLLWPSWVKALLNVRFIGPAVINLIAFLLSLYFMLVAFSFHQELKGQNANAEVEDTKPVVEVV